MVNQHNEQNHLDQNCMHWAPASIIHSSYYHAESGVFPSHSSPRPEYTRPHGLTTKEKTKDWEWGDAEYSPIVTKEDRDMLAKAKVRW